MTYLDDLAQAGMRPWSTSATVIYLKDVAGAESPGSLKSILGMEDDHLSTPARGTLQAFEEHHGDDVGAAWLEFKWRLLAFVSLQDVFDSPVLKDRDPVSSFRLWYFYCESKHLLTESLLALLSGLYAASQALFRPFLEFALLQIYFYRRVHAADSYSELRQYFHTGRVPGWHRLLKTAFPTGHLGSTVSSRCRLNLRALSESTTHAYQPLFSPKALGAWRATPTFQGAFSWRTLSTILQSALWTYYVNFPALFTPVDIPRRFGFNPPVGMLVDDQCAGIVARTLTAADLERFQAHARSSNDIEALLEFYRSRPRMTDQEILASWPAGRDQRPQSVLEGHVMTIAQMRATREALAWPEPPEVDLPEEMLDALDSIDGWQKLQALLARRRRRKPSSER